MSVSPSAGAALDAVLEFTVVPSFTRAGYALRRRVDQWSEVPGCDIAGRVVVITGATSGLGRQAARQLAEAGAVLLVVGRRAERNAAVVAALIEETGNPSISHVAADMGDLVQVRALAERILADHDRLDVLVHNAGALSPDRRTAPDGTEATVASQVVGPFLLTSLLLERLAATPDARVLTMSSGGMYTAPLTVSALDMDESSYRGAEQYARAKRAQVVLNEMWAERYGDTGVRFHSLHPGWADTPGVDESLPTFAKVMGPLLRSSAQGADTLVWLASDDGEPLTTNGLFWHDRRPRATHRLRSTRSSDSPERRERLWAWVEEKAGLGPPDRT